MNKLTRTLMISVAIGSLSCAVIAQDAGSSTNVLNDAVDSAQDTVNSTVDTTQDSTNEVSNEGGNADSTVGSVTGNAGNVTGNAGDLSDVADFNELLSIMNAGNTDVSDIADISDLQVVDVSDVANFDAEAFNGWLNGNSTRIDALHDSLNGNSVLEGALSNNNVTISDVVAIDNDQDGSLIVYTDRREDSAGNDTGEGDEGGNGGGGGATVGDGTPGVGDGPLGDGGAGAGGPNTGPGIVRVADADSDGRLGDDEIAAAADAIRVASAGDPAFCASAAIGGGGNTPQQIAAVDGDDLIDLVLVCEAENRLTAEQRSALWDNTVLRAVVRSAGFSSPDIVSIALNESGSGTLYLRVR